MSYFCRNLFEMFASDSHRNIVELRNEISSLKEDINNFQVQQILTYASQNEEFANNYKDELKYIKVYGMTPFPYENVRQLGEVEGGYEKGMPYVIHKNKKLFFPKTWNLSYARQTYRNYIENENLLGGGFKRVAPHRYQTDDFCVEEGDIVIDLGCAEALFALDSVEKAGKVVVVESDVQWIDALKATFEPYGDKCRIVNRIVSGIDSTDSITLKTMLENEGDSPVFLKMDIEGYEYETLVGSSDFLRARHNMKIACCTYHKSNDAERISTLLASLGYKCEFSEGSMLFPYDIREFCAPYFRKGLVRAEK